MITTAQPKIVSNHEFQFWLLNKFNYIGLAICIIGLFDWRVARHLASIAIKCNSVYSNGAGETTIVYAVQNIVKRQREMPYYWPLTKKKKNKPQSPTNIVSI